MPRLWQPCLVSKGRKECNTKVWVTHVPEYDLPREVGHAMNLAFKVTSSCLPVYGWSAFCFSHQSSRSEKPGPKPKNIGSQVFHTPVTHVFNCNWLPGCYSWDIVGKDWPANTWLLRSVIPGLLRSEQRDASEPRNNRRCPTKSILAFLGSHDYSRRFHSVDWIHLGRGFFCWVSQHPKGGESASVRRKGAPQTSRFLLDLDETVVLWILRRGCTGRPQCRCSSTTSKLHNNLGGQTDGWMWQKPRNHSRIIICYNKQVFVGYC